MFGKLFGSKKVVDASISAIDSAFFTEEEKSAALERKMTLKAALLKAYEPFKVAQRALALLYGVPYVLAWFATFCCSFFMDVKQQFDLLLNSDIAIANLIILGFYFAGGAGESIFKYRGKK